MAARPQTKVLNSWRKLGRSQWEIGDMILGVCGPPNSSADGKRKVKELGEYLLKHGIKEASPNTVKKYRLISMRFPKERRHKELSWAVHYEAREPDALDALCAIYQEKEKGKITRTWVRNFMSSYRAALDHNQQRRWEEYMHKSRPEFDGKPWAVVKRENRRRYEEERQNFMAALPRPEPSEMVQLMEFMKFRLKVNEALVLAEQVNKLLEEDALPLNVIEAVGNKVTKVSIEWGKIGSKLLNRSKVPLALVIK